jgi:hypothetical protein
VAILYQAAEIRRPVKVGVGMSVVAFILLTVAVFSLLGLVQKVVEGL